MKAGHAGHPGGSIFAGAAGVIFDLNGVLVEDEPLHEAAFIATLAPYGISLTHEMYEATILGQADARGVIRLAKAAGASLPIEAIVHAKKSLYQERLRAEGARYAVASARVLVEALSARGMRLALASASPAVEVYAWLSILGLDTEPIAFDPVFTSESDPGPKPNPAVYAAIRDSWEIPAHECVVIDDHPENIAIANALGMRTAGIASTLPPSAFTHAQLVARTIAELCV